MKRLTCWSLTLCLLTPWLSAQITNAPTPPRPAVTPAPAVVPAPATAAVEDPRIAEARGVLRRTLGDVVGSFDLALIPPASGGRDVFERQAAGGRLTVRGSSPVALCRGAYDYLRATGCGIVQWTGTRQALPTPLPDSKPVRVICPFKHRYYLNVCTYGYTMPYWDWPRWEREIDWMAVHGINLPLALVATEAIAERVWLKLGLTQAESDAFFTGPAHAPWNRMGNIIGWDGPPPAGWFADQIALQKQILARLRALGIEPIAPAFAGFVPPAFAQHFPQAALKALAWGGFAAPYRTPILAPGTPLFEQVGKLYVEEWEKEFGKAAFFLADSVNAMSAPLPADSAGQHRVLNGHGEGVYKAIAAADPQATWVMQSWTFGYDKSWTREQLSWLLEKVPKEKLLMLDVANDYWPLYKRFDGFFGKPWVYSVIPNMGGKVPYTGKLDFYATGAADARQAALRGNLVGCGFAPEGIENNEVIYELLADAAWSDAPIDLSTWLPAYCNARYGGYPDALRDAWALLQQTVYGTFIDHPRFGWQLRPGPDPRGTVNADPRFFTAVERFLECGDQFRDNPLYRADAIELSSLYLAHKADERFSLAGRAWTAGATNQWRQAGEQGLHLLRMLDTLLESHPNHRLQNWVDFARGHSDNLEVQARCEANARRLVTTWGGELGDYSARLWSGLIRDYYMPRWQNYFAAQARGETFDFATWEEQWVKTIGFSKVPAFPDPVSAGKRLIAAVKMMPLPQLPKSADKPAGMPAPAPTGTGVKK